tara:strand:+ start:409 stop:735 length:327 start_codon:yes stop_codon:yes gene_type:complete
MSENTTPENTPDGGLSSTVLLGSFLKLKNDGTIVSLYGILSVYVTDNSGSNWDKCRRLIIKYRDCAIVDLGYGNDRDHATIKGALRDEDFEQIKDALIPLPNSRDHQP